MKTSLAFCLALAAASASQAASVPPPPLFPKGATVDTLQGVKVADPYRAMENPGDPAVQAWSDAQNARTRAYLDALPGRAAVAAKISRLTRTASPSFRGLQARGLRCSVSTSIPNGSSRRWL